MKYLAKRMSRRQYEEFLDYLYYLEEVVTEFLWNVTKISTVIIVIVATILFGRDLTISMADTSLHIKEIRPESLPVDVKFRLFLETLDVPEEIKYQEMECQEITSESVSIQETENFSAIYQYTQDDVYLLAQLMYAEEGSFFRNYLKDPEEVERVHKLCGSVVLHRAENNHLNCSTIKDVIFYKGQYAQQTIDRVKQGQDIPEIVYTWAEDLLETGALGPKGLIYQSEFEQGERFDTIGNQIFGVESKYN